MPATSTPNDAMHASPSTAPFTVTVVVEPTPSACDAKSTAVFATIKIRVSSAYAGESDALATSASTAPTKKPFTTFNAFIFQPSLRKKIKHKLRNPCTADDEIEHAL